MTVHAPTRTDRSINYHVLIEVIVLGGTTTMLLSKWLRGQLGFYIHPRYTLMTIIGALILLLMAGMRLRAIFAEQPTRGPGWPVLLLTLPLLLGTLVPTQPLGASTLAIRGISTRPAAQADTTLSASNWMPRDTSDPSSWTLLDWSFALSLQDDQLAGQTADVVGFVFHDAQSGPDTFYATRFVITCCAADGMSVALPVRWEGGGDLPLDSWVHVRGTIGSAEVAGSIQPVILASQVEPIPAPDNPYLYP